MLKCESGIRMCCWSI